MLSKEIFVNRVEGVTVQSVEAFYRFKSKIKVIKDKDALIQICREEGIVIDGNSANVDLTELRKRILNNYLSIHFSKESSKSVLEQREKQESNIKKLTEYL